MTEQAMYRDKSCYYDLIYSSKPYEKETKHILKLIRKYKKNKGKELLEVACGTGTYITYFKRYFNCMGADINSSILARAMKKNPDVTFVRQDMAKLNLDKKFDVIICLFSSIGYLTTKQQIVSAFKRFKEHLNKGGVLIIEPWLTPDKYKKGYPHLSVFESEEIKICRMNVSRIQGMHSLLKFHWLIAKRGGDTVEHFTDEHKLRLTTHEEFKELGKKAGLKIQISKSKYFTRDLVLAVK